MNTQRTNSRSHPISRLITRQWWSAPMAFLVTLLALPVNATIIGMPDVPLTTGSRVAPNILLILDDSGSMENNYMPDIVPPVSIFSNRLTYTRNSLSYNPAVTYVPWTQANGSRMTAGTAYTDVYSDESLLSGSLNLSSSLQTFYVPKDTSNDDEAYLADGTNYYLYQILPGATDIQRGVYGAAIVVDTTPADTTPPGYPQTVTYTAGTGNTVVYSFTVPAGLKSIVVTTSGGSHGNNSPNWTNGNGDGVDLYVDDDNNPTSGPVCSDISNGNDETCTINNPSAGTWYVGLYTASRYKNVAFNVTFKAMPTYTTNRCDGGNTTGNAWIDCVSALPNVALRNTLAKELTNYATWYSYHRTRIKIAKAGAGDAFKAVGYKSRVGFRTIWGRNTFDIPVLDGNDGRFADNPATVADEGASRATWYSRLYGAQGSSTTPLRTALTNAGEYFRNTANTGPYGGKPEGLYGGPTGKQYSCRQNFAILTTDGYWNNDSASVNNADNTSSSTITGPKGQTYTYTAAAPYRDSYSNTLADVAMHYWKTDLRTAASFGVTGSEDNNVSVSAGDPAFWQHMVTFGISIGLETTLGLTSVNQALASPPAWPDPVTGTPGTDYATRIDDLLHAALNGHGSFVAASSPAAFAAGLRAALQAIDQRTSSYSNVATNSVSLDTGAQVFNASYTAGVWTGAVNARAVSESGVSATISWSASIPTSGRTVLTSQGGALVPFLTSSRAAALERPVGATELYPISAVLNASYINGDRSEEESNGGTLRNRNSLLGDIVGSSPAYVKDTNTLYVGANDGMLHAFNAATGNELFAYLPGIIDWNALKSYSSGEYSHRFFVDGPIVVSAKSLTPNKNILVGALGKGGTGLYALDVTNQAAPAFKWEMQDTPSGGYMGKVLGKPVLGSVLGTPSVILGNGVDSTSNQAALIIVKNIDSSSPTTVVVPAGSDGTATNPNALFAPTAVLGKDGKTVATVYAGDMLGNLWKFDLSTSTPTAKKLFAAGSSKQITGGVAVAIDPKTSKRWVFFGTGRFLIDADISSTGTQSMYGIIDSDVLVADSDLDVQDAPVVSGDKRSFQSKTALVTGKKGWRVDLPISGERIVQDMQVVSTFLVSASMIPTGDACGADGRGYINALDAFTGTSAGGSYFDVPGEDTIDGLVGGIPIGSVDVGNGMPTLPNLLRGLLVVGGTGGSELRSLKTLTPRWDRVSWREVRTD